TDFSSSRQVLLTQQEPIPVGDIRVRWSPTPSVLEPEHRYDFQLDYTPVQDYIFVYALWLYKLNAQGQPDAASAVRWNLNGEPGAFPDCFQGCPTSPCPLIGYRYSPAMTATLQLQPGSEVYVRLKAVWTRTISPCVPTRPPTPSST